MRDQQTIRDFIKEMEEIRDTNKNNWDVTQLVCTIDALRWALGDTINLKARVLEL